MWQKSFPDGNIKAPLAARRRSFEVLCVVNGISDFMRERTNVDFTVVCRVINQLKLDIRIGSDCTGLAALQRVMVLQHFLLGYLLVEC